MGDEAEKVPASKKIKTVVGFGVYYLVIVVAFDVLVLNKLLGFGYPRDYPQENLNRYPAPYVAFTGKPNVNNHNENGFRGPTFAAANPGDLKIAFFGGSTGKRGDPPIAAMMEKNLEAMLATGVLVVNHSVVASNHRQHLHGIIEYLPQHRPDLVIFYGGYNEIIQPGSYDPRPGYPYNHFYRAETGLFSKLLLENSAVVGELDKRVGLVSGIGALRDEHSPFSDEWNGRITDKYFETLMLASKVAGSLESDRFGRTKFLAFYQPYQVPDKFVSQHEFIKNRIDSVPYVHDVSSEYDALGTEVYSDIVHVNQKAKEVMARKLSDVVVKALKAGDNPLGSKARDGAQSNRGR